MAFGLGQVVHIQRVLGAVVAPGCAVATVDAGLLFDAGRRACVRERHGEITIAGPAIRLTAPRMLELGAALNQAAGELAMASTASPIFVRQAAARQAAA